MPPDKIGVFIADDHEMVLKGLSDHISTVADMRVIGAVSNGVELLKNLGQQHDQVDVALVDIGMEEMDGLEATSMIKEAYKNIKVIAITGMKGKNFRVDAIHNHVDGFVAKCRSLKEIADAIRRVYNGEIVILPDPNESDEVQVIKKIAAKALPDLSPIEHRILCMIVKGKSSKEIADELRMSQPNVERYRRNLTAKFEVPNTAALVSKAVRSGLCPDA